MLPPLVSPGPANPISPGSQFDQTREMSSSWIVDDLARCESEAIFSCSWRAFNARVPKSICCTIISRPPSRRLEKLRRCLSFTFLNSLFFVSSSSGFIKPVSSVASSLFVKSAGSLKQYPVDDPRGDDRAQRFQLNNRHWAVDVRWASRTPSSQGCFLSGRFECGIGFAPDPVRPSSKSCSRLWGRTRMSSKWWLPATF